MAHPRNGEQGLLDSAREVLQWAQHDYAEDRGYLDEEDEDEGREEGQESAFDENMEGDGGDDKAPEVVPVPPREPLLPQHVSAGLPTPGPSSRIHTREARSSLEREMHDADEEDV